MDVTTVKRIFEASDINKDGYLDEVRHFHALL